MRLSWISAALASASLALGQVTWTATPLNPPSVPLAVRSPYISTWLPQGAGTALNAAWPQFWTGSIAGWAGYIKVDGTTYNFLGVPTPAGAQKATQTAFKYTATRSIFTMNAGPVTLTATFLSPVTPTDLLRQSIPFSYLLLSAASNDGKSHSVQLYTDISGEWVGTATLPITWSTSTGSIFTHNVQLRDQSTYDEQDQIVKNGAAYYSTSTTNGLTYQTGEDNVLRAAFIANGKLANTQDTQFRNINDRWPVFAFAHDLGSVSTTATAPVVISVGHVRDPAIQYITANNGRQDRSSYFFSKFSNPTDVISFFHGDLSNAQSTADTFDSKVQTDASKISSDYASVVALSIRQAFAAIEITLSKSNGVFNTNDVLLFMKEISSDGNVDTVDVIFPAWPLFLYTNPQLGAQLLEPLFLYQSTGQYPNKWSIHDMGASYPKALGHNDGNDEAMPVEESGNMLIMALSYALKTNDNTQLNKYFNLLDQWTQFLITDSLKPGNQISTDDFAGPLANQTNLAIKGIIGIKAMSIIAQRLGKTAMASNYSSIAANYVQQFQGFALAQDGSHLTLSYGDQGSWGLTYNLWADKLLKTNLFPASIYTTQTNWYSKHVNAFGVPLDTRHTYTKSDWEIFTASIMTTTQMRDTFIQNVRKYADSRLSQDTQPLGDWYETTNGNVEGFRARPVVGGHLAILALQ